MNEPEVIIITLEMSAKTCNIVFLSFLFSSPESQRHFYTKLDQKGQITIFIMEMIK